ncbi:MAG: YitT family protein [Muribaculaceae bacterium]|nr:YitT family protein [Muribaculaceae bacterium]
MQRSQLLTGLKDYFFITFGIAIYAFGFSAFLAPENVITGGMAGIGQVLYYFSLKLFGYGIPVAVSMYAINIIMLAIAFRVVGKQFVIRTIFGVTIISVFIGVLQPFFPEPIVKGQPFMNVIIGSMLAGVGVGLAIVHNGSTGGTDIVGAIMSKKRNISFGRTMQCMDICTISCTLLIFGVHDGLPRFVYGLITLLIVSVTMDQVINSNRSSVQFTIFSKKWEYIATAINNEAHRGCTVLNGMGWYSKKEVKVLLVICRRLEATNISRIIKSIDPNAFVTQAAVQGVYGEGFDELKTPMKKPRKAHHVETLHSPQGHEIIPTAASFDTPDRPQPAHTPAEQASHSGHPSGLA